MSTIATNGTITMMMDFSKIEIHNINEEMLSFITERNIEHSSNEDTVVIPLPIQGRDLSKLMKIIRCA